MFGSEWMIIWAFVNTGLFVVAVSAAFTAAVSNQLAEHFGKDSGWRSVASWTRLAAQVFTLLLLLVLFGTTLVIAALVAYYLLRPG
jgi:hypothetical protein